MTQLARIEKYFKRFLNSSQLLTNLIKKIGKCIFNIIENLQSSLQKTRLRHVNILALFF